MSKTQISTFFRIFWKLLKISVFGILNVIDSDFTSMLQIMLAINQKRFSVILQDKFMIIANCIDPRFALFALGKQNAVVLLKKTMGIVLDNEHHLNTPTTQTVKKVRIEKGKGLFDNLHCSSVACASKIDINVIENELFVFKSEVKLVKHKIETNPINWLRRHGTRMPHLFMISQIYLLPNPSIAENERVFSIAGRTCRPHRASLDVKNLEMLVTVKHRLRP